VGSTDELLARHLGTPPETTNPTLRKAFSAEVREGAVAARYSGHLSAFRVKTNFFRCSPCVPSFRNLSRLSLPTKPVSLCIIFRNIKLILLWYGINVGVCYPAERSPAVHTEGLGRTETRNRKAVPRSRARGGSIVYANTSWPRGEVSKQFRPLSSAELTQHQRETIQGSNQ
jgi:hypothetical protein